MFNQITEKFETIFKNIRGLGKINDSNIDDTVREVRRALLDADVNFKVVKSFINTVKEKAQGVKVLKSIKPGQQFVKIIHNELIVLLGSVPEELNLNKEFSIILLTGLQGAGKTTTAGKLALMLQKKEHSVMLVAADIYRPGAIKQLKIVSEKVGSTFYSEENSKPVDICKNAIKKAKSIKSDIVIIDTAGRLHIDQNMMLEIKDIYEATRPNETLFVADGMTGQDAVNSAKSLMKFLN